MNYNNPLTGAQYQALLAGLASPPILANCITGFVGTANVATQGVDISFAIADTTGIDSVVLVRNFVQDIATATVLNTWSAPQEAGYVWSDTDSLLQQEGQVFYWLILSPTGASGTPLNVGPLNVVLNPDLTAPSVAFEISASHAAAVSGTILVTVNVSGGPVGGTIKIYVSGYQGVSSPVAVAQSATSPIQFTLQDTGETVTFTAETVSSGGVETTGGPTTTLVLNSGETVPAEPVGVTVAALSSGNQVSWPANADDVTQYQVWRGPEGSPFSSAIFQTNVSPTSAKTMQYLDTGGLAGSYAYFIVAVNGVGSSLPSVGASVILIPASSVIYNDGSTVQGLQPTQVGADHTLSHVVISSIYSVIGGSPPGPVALVDLTEVINLSWAFTVNDPSDVFNISAAVQWTGSANGVLIQVVGMIDGDITLQFGYGIDTSFTTVATFQVVTFFGSFTGLTAGAHVVTLYYWCPPSINVGVPLVNSTGFQHFGTFTQISS